MSRSGAELARLSFTARFVSGEKEVVAYLTRFWVHSRSRFVSRAVFRPSEKFARAPFRRRWARAWSSSSSCCFALSWPDLMDFIAVSLELVDSGIDLCLFCKAFAGSGIAAMGNC